MRILHVVVTVDKNQGGLGAAALGLAGGQQQQGARAAVWTLASPDTIRQAREEFGQGAVEVIGFPTWEAVYSPSMLAGARKALGASFDILHQHSLWLAPSHVTLRWRRAFRRITVVAPHGTLEPYALARSTWKKQIAAWLYERRNLRAASCLQATSKAEAANFRRLGLANPIAVIPNAIPDGFLSGAADGAGFRRRHRLPDSARLMLFMSRVHPQKGLPLLLEALSRLGRQLAGWQLVIAGPDEAGHVAELKRLAARLGVASVVHFVGPVYGQDKRDALAAADLFVLPSYSESLAIVVAEALAMCVPVLTTRGAPWDELLEHRCGWWTETTVAGIQAGLSDAIHRPAAELAAMGQRGAALVAGRYTWAVVAEKSLQLYAWLLNQAPRPEFVWLE